MTLYFITGNKGKLAEVQAVLPDVEALDIDLPEIQSLDAHEIIKAKLVVVGHPDRHYTPPGGAIEKGETFEEAAIREIKEETNMKVLHIECIGFQDVEPPGWNRVARQFRMFALVEPYGEFVSDPDGDISHIKLIDPGEYKEYIKWGEVGDHLMKRALDIKQQHNV